MHNTGFFALGRLPPAECGVECGEGRREGGCGPGASRRLQKPGCKFGSVKFVTIALTRDASYREKVIASIFAR
jgi:hypothetical protein